jgi:hypothetical protein
MLHILGRDHQLLRRHHHILNNGELFLASLHLPRKFYSIHFCPVLLSLYSKSTWGWRCFKYSFLGSAFVTCSYHLIIRSIVGRETDFSPSFTVNLKVFAFSSLFDQLLAVFCRAIAADFLFIFVAPPFEAKLLLPQQTSFTL